MRKILIADDEAVVQKLLLRILAAGDYQVLSVGSGAETVRMAELEGPDLILLDVNMPDKSGLEVLRELRRDMRTQAIPVILVTGNGRLSDRIGGLDLGADDYVTKPFEPEELKARVGSVLRRSHRELSANPLTHLPGSPVIEEEVHRRIQAGEPFAFLYADIDSFKAYNDAYGYSKGDQVIHDAAGILLDSLQAEGGNGDFLGHVGGDDFVLVCAPERARRLAEHVTGLFDRSVPGYYSPEDRARGFLERPDRLGRLCRFPLMTLSVGAVTTERRRLTHYARVVELASEMKRYVKSRAEKRSSSFAFDRRNDDGPRAAPAGAT